MNRYQLHVDTVNKTSGDPFNCTILLKNSHRNLRSIALKNAQIPVGFYNVRAPYNVITINSVNYTMNPGNYTTMTSFINALNSTVTPAIGTFSYSTTTNLITFVSGSGSSTINTTFNTLNNDSNMSLTTPSLGALMGFSNNSTGTSISAVNGFNLAFDTYLNVYIPNLGTSSLDATLCTFKIPVGGTQVGSTIYWNPPVDSVVNISDKSAKVDKLNILVLDRYGLPVTNNGMDWSFTIEFCADT